MNRFNKLPTLFFFLSLLCLSFAACDDDDGFFADPLTYDPDQHIYGTASLNSFTQEWEVIIDPVTGRFDSIPGTFREIGGISFPTGARSLQVFNPNQRIYLVNNSTMEVQDLESLVTRSIILSDPVSGRLATNPQYLTSGSSDNIVLMLDSNGSIWRIDTEAGSAEILLPDLDLDGRQIAYFFSNANATQLYFFTNAVSANYANVNRLYVYHLGSSSVVDELELPLSFGFVEDPEAGLFYYLTIPTDDTGFRLRVIRPLDNGILEGEVSGEDLAIDALLDHQQTIHSATNSYLALSSNSSFDDPRNKLYRINLNTGLLEGEVELEGSKHVTKIAGE